MSEPDGRGRGQSAAPPPGFSGRVVAPFEWVAFAASGAAFLCLLMPWFAVGCPPGEESAGCPGVPEGAEELSVRGLDLALAVVGGTLLLLGGLLPVLRHVERALTRSNAAAPPPAPRPTLLAPLFATVGAVLVFLQLVRGYAAGADPAAEAQHKYGLILAFIAALIAGGSAVLGHVQAHGHRLLPSAGSGAPAQQP